MGEIWPRVAYHLPAQQRACRIVTHHEYTLLSTCEGNFPSPASETRPTVVPRVSTTVILGRTCL
jgi:hypothetical protein